jgi:hypothetical protein
MKKIIYTLIIIILVIVIVFAIRFLIGGSEDTWICDDGEWVKHGVPSAPMPDKACPGAGDKVIITNFDECIQAGNPAMESYPRRCRTEDNNEFIEDIGNELEKQDLIQIDSPRPNQKITSPLIIEGRARGFWFFEGDFPVNIYDKEDNLIATGIATAQGEWMTEDFVEFKAELTFSDVVAGQKGVLILEKDNPSGLPENADELRVPIEF